MLQNVLSPSFTADNKRKKLLFRQLDSLASKYEKTVQSFNVCYSSDSYIRDLERKNISFPVSGASCLFSDNSVLFA